MSTISVFESNTHWMDLQKVNEAQQLAAEKRKIDEAGALLDAEWAKPEPDSTRAEIAAENAKALSLAAADKAAGRKPIETEDARSTVSFSLIKKGLEELQKGGKTIGQIGQELEIGNYLLKRVRFLAEFFDISQNSNVNKLDAIIKAHAKFRCGNQNVNKVESLIKHSEPLLQRDYDRLYTKFNCSDHIPTYSSFPPSHNPVQGLPLFKGVIFPDQTREWDPCFSEDEGVPQSFPYPSNAFLSSTPTYWDWPTPSTQSNETASSTSGLNRKRKTPADPDATPTVTKKEKKVLHTFPQVAQAISEYQKGEKDVKQIARENGLSCRTLKHYIRVLETSFKDGDDTDTIDDTRDRLGYIGLSNKNLRHSAKIALPAKDFYLNHPLKDEPEEAHPFTDTDKRGDWSFTPSST